MLLVILIQSSYQEALGQESLRPAGAPSIETTSGGEGKDLEYTATFEVYPDLAGLTLSGLKIERTLCEISDQDIDTTLDSLRRQRIEWNSIDGEAKEGNRVTLDFTGSVDGEPFTGGEGKGHAGGNRIRLIDPGFEESADWHQGR